MPVQEIGQEQENEIFFYYLFTVYLKHCKELHHLALDKVRAPPLAVGKVSSTESTEKRENPEEY